MAIREATAVRDAQVLAIAAATDAGPGPGLLRVYSGPQPATADAAATGDLLVEIALNDPAWTGPTDGVITLAVSPEPAAAAVASGDAGWARLVDSTGATVLDGSVATSGGDFTITSTAIVASQTVTLTGGTLTRPGA